MSWQIDSNHSHIQFSVRHMMISTVRGRFERFTGTIEGDEQDPTRSHVEVQIEAASVDTRSPQRDADLRSANFLDADNYPYLTFTSSRIEQIDSSHGRITGDLTIRGVSREVVLDVEYAGQAKSPWGTTSAGFSATTKINRKDWGLAWNVALETGGVMVGDEVKIDIELELVKQADQAQEAGATA
ncbi:MAG TPA: YceI family protein [Roseiflexaceae bacterium]|nr:YceI family protein [Roseiflexaceae bacterium]